MPSISEVGEIGIGSSAPITLPSLPSISEHLPSISEVGEIGVGLPHLPSLPSMADVGSVLPSLPIPISEVGEVMAPPVHGVPLTPHSDDERRAMREYGAMEAERGLDRHDRGENVVGIGGDTGAIGEDGGIFPTLFGGSEEMQEFGRLHDIEAALAEKEGGGAASDPYFTIANGITAAVGGAVVSGVEIANMFPEQYGGTAGHPGRRGTLDSGGLGASAANAVWELMGYSTGDYEDIENDAIARHRQG